MAPGVGAETELARDATFASDRPRQRARLAISGVYLDPMGFSLAGPTAFRRLRTCGARPVIHPRPPRLVQPAIRYPSRRRIACGCRRRAARCVRSDLLDGTGQSAAGPYRADLACRIPRRY